MTCAPAALAELLADCHAHGIRLLPAPDGGLTIDAPQDALTPGLVARLKAHKAALLALLQPTPDAALIGFAMPTEATTKRTAAVCRCGSTTWRDVPIHDGQSVRRDCAGCRRFIGFPVWHGQEY